MKQLLVMLFLVVLNGCMPYKPVASKVTTGPVPTIKAATTVMTKPKELLEKAIAARGGEAQLKKQLSLSTKGKGRSAPLNIVANFQFRTITALPNRIRDETDYEDGTKFVQVLDRDKGWVSINGTVKEMDAVNFKSMQESLYFSELLTLVPMREERYTLEPLPEQRKEGVIVQGFIVKSKDHSDVTFYFEKENNLLLLGKTKVIDPNSLIEHSQETYFTSYESVQGLLFPKRWVIYTDGNKSMELNFEEMKFIDKMDPIFFVKP